MIRIPLLVLGLILLASPARAGSPGLGAVSPTGVQRGVETPITLSGGRLKDAQEILFYTPGITVSELKVVNDNTVTAKLKVAPDCRLGEHALRLRTGSGLSDLRTITVGALPVVAEKEPNSEQAQANPVALNTTVHGDIGSEDVDYFKVEAKKGQRLSAEIEGMRLGRYFDPYIAILDSKRFELAAADDSPLARQDAFVSAVVPEDGTYFIQVRDSAYTGAGTYRLHVGTFPRPAAAIPAGGKPGEEVEVTFLGDPAGPIKQKVKLPATPDDKFVVHAQDANGLSPSGVPFRVNDCTNVLETDNNQSHATATPAPAAPVAFNGVVSKPGEVDHFKFPAKKGQVFDIHCYARRIGSPLDPVTTLSVAGAGAFVANDDAVGPDSYFRVTMPDDKDFVLTVGDHLGKGGPTYFYRVEVRPVEQSLTLSFPKVALFSQERQTVPVPRGNRYAALVQVGKTFGGPIQITADGLPAGLTFATDTPATEVTGLVPVVFEAAPQAALAGTLTNLSAKPLAQGVTATGRFDQTVELVTGGPGQSVYWTYRPDRPAVAVTEAVPFKINVVEPKVPLVQNGSMNLRIVAERSNGFKGPITVQMLTNPPGIGSASSATIAPEQTETSLVVNAAGNAPARSWKFAVIAQADAGYGPVWVSSQLATLEVAAPFFAFAMERSAVEQGKNTTMYMKVTQTTPFEGPAKVRLVGLPAKVTAPELEMTKDTKELSFPVAVDKTAPAGTHRNIFCQAIVMKNGEPIAHNVGGSELRIDVPLPPKPNAPPPAQAAKPTPAPAQPAAPKRLSRLEQLRLEQQEREKAGKK
jgi:hypothetical protein